MAKYKKAPTPKTRLNKLQKLENVKFTAFLGEIKFYYTMSSLPHLSLIGRPQ